MKTKKVKIVKATCLHSGNKGYYFKEVSPWYDGKIGEVFEVFEDVKDCCGNDCYNVTKDGGYGSGLYIKVEDCEDVI